MLADAVAQLLRSAHIPAHKTASLDSASALAALIMPLHLLLEVHQWSFASVRRSRRVHEAVAAGQEAVAVVAHTVRSPWLGLVASAAAWFVVWGVLMIAPLFVPFDLEAFFRSHFGGKLSAQTVLLAQEVIGTGASAGLPTPRLEALLREAYQEPAPQAPLES